MSVIPLSATDRSSGEGPSETTTTERPGAFDHNGAATKAVDEAVEKLFAHEDVPQEKDLDKLVGSGVDRFFKGIEEREAFDRSKESRDTLNRSYKQFGATTKETLGRFVGFHEKFKRDPIDAGGEIAEAYYALGPYGQTDAKAEEKPKAWFDHEGKRHNRKVLDHLIDAAQNSNESGEFEATAEERKKLNEVWPNLPFDEQMKRLVEIDNRLRANPMLGASEIAGSYGLPVTPRQQQAYVERQNANAHIAHAAQRLPGMDQQEVRHAMANVIADRNFVSSGDAQQDLQNAHSIVMQHHQQTSQGHMWTHAQVQQIEKANPALARAIVDTLFKDAEFVKYAGSADPVNKFNAAVAWTKARMSSTKRGVDRAKRAMPVKSSSGAIPTGSGKGSGLDAAISYAMRDWR